MKNILFCLLPFLCLAQNKQDTFLLEIILDKDFPGYVYLAYEEKIDSSLVVDKKLSFKGTVAKGICSTGFMLAHNQYFRMSKPIYLENNNITISAAVHRRPVANDTLTTFEIKSITGSQTDVILETLDSFKKKNQSDPNYAQKLLKKVDAVITENPKSPIAAGLLHSLLDNTEYKKESLKRIYFKINRGFQDEYPMRKIENYLFPERFLKTNDPMFHFALPNDQNLLFSTETLRGKWILLDFWASWCGPCREQFPELKRIYETYKSKNFEIVAISIDKIHLNWLQALNDESPEWINVIENQGTSGPIARKYNLPGVPHNYLIDPEGKIIANNIDLKMLEKVLQGM